MKRKDRKRMGLSDGPLWEATRRATAAARRAGWKRPQIKRRLERVTANPEQAVDDPIFGPLAQALVERREVRQAFAPRSEPAPYRRWGTDDVDPQAVAQMENACRLPVAVAGALMPDAHLGYGLPIGGVLATSKAVIPYAVGVDIACRMKMTVLDLPAGAIEGQRDRLVKALEKETRFGIGASFDKRRQHEVMDDPGWSTLPLTRRLKDKAWAQLGTSGSGNHFVEYGVLEIEDGGLELPPGRYLALLSHSGSRGAGATIAGHYSKLAMELHPELPKELRHLAWLDLDSEPGQEYWQAMELMGRYAAANHACIHRHVVRALGAKVLLEVENHHNFAWREEHEGESLIVHRKGATPAGEGVLGIIPGSMASPAFLVRGKGETAALRSAAHGAGRRMSRKQAKQSFTWSETRKLLAERGVTLLSAGLDEVPMAYRDIEQVMAAQQDLVAPLARFIPRIVKMAPAGERPED
ncbi:MAG: RtcB family protein [Acidobacteria bacterium]|nr:MAG: RtcB family protein [Acidobacteriota bacterium]